MSHQRWTIQVEMNPVRGFSRIVQVHSGPFDGTLDHEIMVVELEYMPFGAKKKSSGPSKFGSWVIASCSLAALVLCGCIADPSEVSVLNIPPSSDAEHISDIHVSGGIDATVELDASLDLDQNTVEPELSVSDGFLPSDLSTLDMQVDAFIPAPPAPVITELMTADRNILRDEEGRESAWIEMYNPYPEPINLMDYALTNDRNQPRHWVFPSRVLESGEFMVIFASNQDRRGEEGPLHTNFELEPPGGYLALFRPDGTPVQVLEGWSFEGDEQSFGIPMVEETRPLLEPNATLRYRLPSDASVDIQWSRFDYDDSLWAEGRFPLGFDTTPANTRGVLLADSVEDWPANGEQGTSGWFYGYWNRSADDDDQYATDEFIPFPNEGDVYGPDNFWDGRKWMWFQGDPPWTSIHLRNMHPNGVNNGAEHWPIRRWQSPVSGNVVVAWILRKSDRGSSGITGYVLHNGQIVDQQSLEGSDGNGIRRDIEVPRAEPGDLIEFALSPIGPTGQTDDFQDRTAVEGSIYTSARLDTGPGTSLNLDGDTPVYVRTSFDVDRPLEPGGGVHVRIQYDDGFALYLNGAQTLTENAPDMLGWSAQALRDREVDPSTQTESFVLDTDLMRPGINQLAIHLLPAAREDGRLWISATIDYVFPILTENENSNGERDWVQTILPVPTPGAPNVSTP